jgi:hypothetical protein
VISSEIGGTNKNTLNSHLWPPTLPASAPSRQSGIGGVKGHNQKDISFPGSPGLWPGGFNLWRAVLKLIKSEINAFLGHQFCMGSGFPNPPFMENDDPISMLDGGKPVSDDNGCPSLE